MSNTTAILRGRLTRDPEIKQVGAKSTTLATFSVACDEGAGENKKTSYIDCKAWARTADDINGMSKGDPIVVFGRLDLESWDDKVTGAKRSKLVVVAEIIDGVARTPKTGAAATKTGCPPIAEDDDGSIPF